MRGFDVNTGLASRDFAPAGSSSGRPPFHVALFVCAVMVAAMAYLRLAVAAAAVLPIAFGVPLVAAAWFRDRRLVWGMVAAFTVISGIKYGYQLRNHAGYFESSRALAFLLVEADMIVIAVVVHLFIGAREWLEVRNRDLERINRDLAEREEQIGVQNEELQVKGEELERQSEELRVTNEELESRERMLEQLLDLSHSLTAELTRGQLVARLCEAVTGLINIPGSAAAILEREGERLRVSACHGFESPLDESPIPWDQSFAALVMDRGQTAYLEDLGLRPDIRVPQAKSGRPMRSILATPLRVHGKPVGTVELYSPERRTWSRQEIALIEALAAQASTSLENARLFEEIDDQRARLETVVRSLPVGVMITDTNRDRIRLNPVAAAMHGWAAGDSLTTITRNDLDARTWELHRDGRPLRILEHPLFRALGGEEAGNEEFELVFFDGRRLSVFAQAVPIRDRRGNLLGAVKTLVDITPIKLLQQELDQRRRDAEEGSVRKTRFLAAVSHDIRTPANAINLLAELMRRASSNPELAAEIPEMAQELQQSATSLVNLVTDVLDVTRFDYGKVDLVLTEFTLASVLTDENRQLQPLADAKGIGLHVDCPGPPVRLRADRMKLARVLSNLIGNAIKFTETGTVTIRGLVLPDGWLRIGVSDTGIGMAPEHLPRIFDEFFQIQNPARDRQKGTGLGLAICKRLVEAMGGRLEVTSEVGLGSTFAVLLPPTTHVEGAGAPAPDPPTAAKPAAPGHDGRAKPLQGVRVLLVEDHQTTRDAVRQLLTHEGAEVITAESAAAAEQLLQTATPEVLLLDMMLPDADGREVLTRLKRTRPASLRKVLVLTGDVTQERSDEVRQLGADGLLHKPMDLAALLELAQRK